MAITKKIKSQDHVKLRGDDDLELEKSKDQKASKNENLLGKEAEGWSLTKLFDNDLENQLSGRDEASDELALQNWKHKSSHPLDTMIGDLKSGVETRSKTSSSSKTNVCAYSPFISYFEPHDVSDALGDNDCILAIHEEL